MSAKLFCSTVGFNGVKKIFKIIFTFDLERAYGRKNWWKYVKKGDSSSKVLLFNFITQKRDLRQESWECRIATS